MDSRMAKTLTFLMFAVLNALSCHSEVRARDPDVEEEETLGHGRTQRMPGTFGTTHLPIPHDHRHPGTPISMASAGTPQNSANPIRERVHPSTHRGNWCAYVNHRVVTKAVLCTETQKVKIVNPCPDGAPDCQNIMYRLSSLPVYKQKQTTLSSLHWQCCPGYRGHNCLEKEDKDHDSKSKQDQLKSQNSGTTKVNDNDDPEEKILTDQLEDVGWDEKSDQQPPIHDPSPPVEPHHSPVGARDGIPTSHPLPILDSSILLSMQQLMSIMMSQLQPVLESFNQTLQRLSGEVDALSRDVQQLRLEKHAESRTDVHGGAIEEKLEYSYMQISQMKAQLDTQKDQMEKALQIQQDLLQQNLTKLKEEMDDQISQSQDVQSLFVLVEEVRDEQKRLEGTLRRERMEEGQPALESRVWEAIARLDKEALKYSAQLNSLSETSEDNARAVQDLRGDLLKLAKKLEEFKKDSEVQFAETGLEMEATRVRVQNSISELRANLSSHEGQLREIELDMDNIYHQLQRNDSTIAEQACNCESITDSMLRLEMEVGNVTRLVRTNQFAVEDADAEVERNQARWVTEVDDLHQGLLTMKESLAFEQGKSRVITNNLSQLKASLLESQQEIRDLKKKDEEKSEEIQGLSATFSSLLSDAVRHSEALEVILGEEVLEFTKWSQSQQKELSIPNLLEKMHLMQQKIESHNKYLASLRKKHPEESEMHSDDPVSYSDWTSAKNQVGSDQDSLDPSTGEDEDVDYSVSDFWTLGKEVEQLAGRINLLEERCGNCTETPGGSVVELQADITSLRQSLEDHLGTYEKLFSNTEELVSSARSLNLDEVWRMVRKKNKKDRKQLHSQKQQIERVHNNSSSRRSKRQTGHALLPHSPVVFVASLDHRTGPKGELTSRSVDVNHGGSVSPSSQMFRAPEAGLYLFLVTLDFQRGRSLAVLHRSGVPVASLRQEEGGTVSRVILLELRQGETVTLELMRGSLRQGQPGVNNTLSGLLLYITEHEDLL
ncbi:multimerin-2 isoform X1 [Misgurnus anguillicaudatus]|uniref:multimerin-2 isoform X1 n=1 Tax=Misgurnus anguillicaudatus TaxID=75329 RepID=UPI003CCF76AE